MWGGQAGGACFAMTGWVEGSEGKRGWVEGGVSLFLQRTHKEEEWDG